MEWSIADNTSYYEIKVNLNTEETPCSPSIREDINMSTVNFIPQKNISL